MPCVFCIAVLAALGGTVTAAVMDEVEERLKKASITVKRMTDTTSVARLEFSMSWADKVVPVAVTVFKKVGRVRIQVLAHELARREVEQLEEALARILDARIVQRSDAEGELHVREAFRQESPPASDPLPDALRRPVR